ncbi:hypothetical protein HD593_006349 [Nonomuraea rubra]|uniref:Uncharacterized protein n=1 Tax=Nonomuraea rubra TaxID=46180 RepID=A0A7X0NY46_9ACTN|nr:hypothetical protein [Nonomuraea rubra]
MCAEESCSRADAGAGVERAGTGLEDVIRSMPRWR